MGAVADRERGCSLSGAGQSSRDAAWHALHDPTTSAESLAAIAAEYPEFAEQILQHPNCYDGLRTWLAELDEPVPVASAPEKHVAAETTSAPAPVASAPGARRGLPRSAVIAASVASVVLLGGGAWAAVAILNTAPSTGPSVADPATSPSPVADSPRQLDGPPVYVGDELDWFTLDDSTIQALFPGAANIERVAEFGGIGESEGIMTDPRACDPWLRGDDWAIVGVRTARWDGGRITVRQFPTGEEAATHYERFAGTTDDCATFSIVAYPDELLGTTTVSVLASDDRGVAAHVVDSMGYNGDHVEVLLQEGNVVLSAFVDVSQVADQSGQAVLDALAAKSAEARQLLTERIGYR